jgi:phosphate transport system permease protein
LLGAIYTSLFAHPKIRNIIKPVVEIMAALPSVVIGFLAGIWLAPVLEKFLPTVFVMFFIMPTLILIAVLVWMQLPKLTGKFIGNGWEIVFIIPLLIISGFIAYWLGPVFEDMFLQGDFRTWLKATFDVSYDQRNAIIVGFAMGFAVIPIIFTICEDSLTSVPEHFKSSSLALGATRWQTAVRIVLPTASPGIFSAVMIGFGRAIGETMIVLMATGNTPILDFGVFNGMRTLSANIAVEIPEAPMAGTLYRVLFLSATLLFIMTFIINTVAEIVRQRLRKKYMLI